MRRFSKLQSESVITLSGKKRDSVGLSRSRRRAKTVESLESRQMLATDLVISEFLTSNTTGPTDNYGVRSDWIEIRNVTSEAISLSGWHLTDDNDNLSMWTFPSQSIAAGAYLIVWASQQDDAVVGQPLHTNFKLNTDGEYLALVRPDLSIASEFAPDYPDQSANISYGRSTSLTTEGYFSTPTFGTANTVDPVPDPAQQIFISEIMYHPAHESSPGSGVWIDDPVTNEWIEIHNRGTQSVNLQNWQIDAGVTFTFPNVSIAAGQNLVIAANVAAFNAKYPGVTNVVGGWTGQLSNRTENVRIVNATGATIDGVEYADKGDWAVRVRGPNDLGFFGWEWQATHDGEGKSLELRSRTLTNNQGQNWGSSTPLGGTPGAQNSINSTNIAPMIVDVAQDLPIPHSNQQVTISARLINETFTGVSGSIKWRLDSGPASFNTSAMFDDGQHGDGAAGDGLYAGQIPQQLNNSIVEFYVEATDGTFTRSYPNFVPGPNGERANLVYQVNDAIDPSAVWTPGSAPIFMFLMTSAERTELDAIMSQSPNSNAQVNGTLIVYDGTGVDLRYNVGIRNRGHGSRSGTPHNYHVNIPSDRMYQGTDTVVTNARTTQAQAVGHLIFQMAGLTASETNPVALQINGAATGPTRNIQVEMPGSDYASNHFPNDDGGNIYRGVRLDNQTQEADFRYEGTNPDAYRDTYFKETNETEDNWTDLINMTNVLNNASDADYLEDVSGVIDVDQWLKYIALNSLLMNEESGLTTGVGDDYALYRGVTDTRFKLVPHDLDSILAQGGFNNTTRDVFSIQGVDGLTRFINHPRIVPLYYKALLDLMQTTFNRATLDPLLDQVLGGWTSVNTINAMKNSITARTTNVLGQIQQNFVVNSALPLVSGYRQTNSSTTTITGTANVSTTQSVMVNGVAATWNIKTGAWTASNVALNPGINRITVKAFSGPAGTGNVVNESFVDIWYSPGGTGSTPISFDLPMGSNWKYLDDDSLPTGNTAWRGEGFNDSSWDGPSPAQLGYSTNPPENDEATTVGFTGQLFNNVNITTYFRTTFTIPADQGGNFTAMTLSILYDDAAVVYLNGTEIDRPNFANGVIIDRTTTPQGSSADNQTRTVDVSQFANLIHNGVNTIAVEIHQATPQSSDISFDMSLSATGLVQSGGGGQPGGTAVSGTISTNTTWTPAAGPYTVTGNLIIAPGATLTIQPGTSVFFNANSGMTVNGRLVAEGTENSKIWITKTPGIAGYHNGIQFISTQQDNRIRHAVIEWGGDNANNGMIGATDSQLTLENNYFDNSIRRRIRTQGSSIIVRNNFFTDIYPGATIPSLNNLSEQIWGGIRSPITQQYMTTGQVLVEGNIFGTSKGHNDAFDVDGGFVGQGHIVPRVINNRFMGGGDDAMDLEGDFYIAGNTLANFVKDVWNTAEGHANGMSLGGPGGHVYWVVGNTFKNVQRVLTAKQDVFVNFVNNTVIDSIAGTISFNPPYEDPPMPRGLGGMFDSNIFVNTPSPFDTPGPDGPYTVTRNILPANQVNLGTGNSSADPRLKDLVIPDVTLMPGSSAIGTGANGIDRGSKVLLAATISGEPPVQTSSNAATLTVGGPGILSYKYRVNGGAWSAETPVATPITLTGLANGSYTVDVAGRNFAGVWQADATATHSKTWTVNTTLSKVIINEVLATNINGVALGATRPDVIELYNAGASAANLADMSITDGLGSPRKFVFPAGTSIPAGGYLVLYADSLPSQAGEIHLGFSLSGKGDGVHLFDKLANGGGLLDEVNFGLQLADKSIGRVGQDRHWALTSPTFGAANVGLLTGDASKLKINEWFTTGQYTLPDGVHSDDFIELFNTDSLPVSMASLYLTDDPVGDPIRHQVASLSFINPSAYAVFNADGNTDSGPEHLSFSLDADHGWLAIRGTDGTIIDRIYYGPQTDGVSQGRVPDGGTTIQFMTPTPGVDSSSPTVPTNLQFTVNNPTLVTFVWDASSDPQSGVTHYRVYRNGVFLNTSATTSYTDNTLVNGATYSYQVSAVNGDGFESALSTSINNNTDTSPPTVPTNLNGSVFSNSTRIDLTWTASTDPQSGIKQYRVYRNNVLIGSPLGTSFSDSTFTAGAPLSYTVSAVNNADVESAKTNALVVAMFQNGIGPDANYAGTDDTMFFESAPTSTTQGTRNFLRMDGEEGNVGQPTQFMDVYSLMRFALTGISAGQQVKSVSLTVSTQESQSGATSNQSYEIYALRRNWNENTANWNQVSTGVNWEVPGAKGATDRDPTVLGALTFSNQAGILTFTLNAAGIAKVQSWVDNPANNFGFIIGNETSSDGLLLDSSEFGVAAERPRLNIIYSSSVTADTTPPTVPTNLIATDNGASAISLAWQPSNDPESGVTKYRVFRDGVLLGEPTTTNFTDPNAVPGRAYSYRVSAVNSIGLESAQSVALPYSIPLDLAGYSVQISSRDSYVPGNPVLVQLAIIGPDGKPLKDLWNAGAVLSSSNPAVTLSTNEIILHNGYGSALVTFNGSGNFNLTANVGNIQSTKALTSLQGAPQTNVSGVLPGAATTWSGVIHVTGDVTVPVGHTLTIQPGTLILLDGNPTAQSTNGVDIIVNGRINALGTANQRITFTANTPTAKWGELNHQNAQPSLYQYVDVTLAGHSPRGGHTNTGPALRSAGSTITFENSAITDAAGKMGQISSSNITFTNTHWARMVMGPEFASSALLMDGTYIKDMLGIYQENGNPPDDNDGIYIHTQGAGQSIIIRNSVLDNGDDDGIDTLGPTVTISNVIIRGYDGADADSKGISVFNGNVDIDHVFTVESKVGISVKGDNGVTMNVNLDRSTITGTEVGIQTEQQTTEQAIVNFNVKNSIIASVDPVKDFYNNGRLQVTYSDMPENYPGTGNLNIDPLWVAPNAFNFHLSANSPVINQGNPADTDPNGTRADMGAFPYNALTTSIEPIVTNDSTPNLTGTVNSPTATVRITVGPNSAYAINNGNGTWTLPGGALPAIADGVYNVFVNVKEFFGSATTDLSNNELTIDTLAPTVTVNTLTTSDTTPALSGTVSDPNATVRVTVNGNTHTAVNNGNGTWTLPNNTLAPLPSGTYNVAATATDLAGNVGNDATAGELIINATTSIAGRFIFYNESRFDDPLFGGSDDAAIAPDKQALLPGGTGTFANYTSYVSGITGIMIDIAGLSGTPTVGDFIFKAGNTITPSEWGTVATAPTITVRPGAGAAGSARITIIWPTLTIRGQWLQTTVKAGGNIGLTTPDVFYFGNAPGESGNVEGDTSVSITDELLARNNPATIANPAGITNRFDYNRDTRVSAVDQIIARNLMTTNATKLKLFQTPASLVAGGLSAQGLADSSDAGVSGDIARGLAVVGSPAVESSTAAGSSFTMSGSSATKLRPQALSAVYSTAAEEPSTRRASGQSSKDVDADLLELLATGLRK